MPSTTHAPAKRGSKKTAAKKVAHPKAPAELVYYPGKEPVEAREASEGTRAREAREGVAPSLGGPDSKVNAFLEPRFVWLIPSKAGDLTYVYGATYDEQVEPPESAVEAAQRATHIGMGRTVAEAKRDLLLTLIREDTKLQNALRVKPTPRATAQAEPEKEAPAETESTPTPKDVAEQSAKPTE